MSDFETVECEQCGDTFRVHPGGNAADKQYCSPSCQEAAEEL